MAQRLVDDVVEFLMPRVALCWLEDKLVTAEGKKVDSAFLTRHWLGWNGK